MRKSWLKGFPSYPILHLKFLHELHILAGRKGIVAPLGSHLHQPVRCGLITVLPPGSLGVLLPGRLDVLRYGGCSCRAPAPSWAALRQASRAALWQAFVLRSGSLQVLRDGSLRVRLSGSLRLLRSAGFWCGASAGLTWSTSLLRLMSLSNHLS